MQYRPQGTSNNCCRWKLVEHKGLGKLVGLWSVTNFGKILAMLKKRVPPAHAQRVYDMVILYEKYCRTHGKGSRKHQQQWKGVLYIAGLARAGALYYSYVKSFFEHQLTHNPPTQLVVIMMMCGKYDRPNTLGERRLGMVQANVGQKLLICDILRVFFGDRFPLIHTTSCKINAIHKLIVIVFLLQYTTSSSVLSHSPRFSGQFDM